MENILEVKNICKNFSKKQVLKDVSFSIREGEILGFIGPNGAGKTTTIKLILGLQSINKGQVLINGYDITKNFEKAIRKVGAIVENPDMYMYLSGKQNLKLVANLYKGVDSKRIDEVVELVGLNNRINDSVSKYSLGMRQRLGIAVALLQRPNLLILDEPTNGLDPEGIKQLRDLLKNLAKKEKMGILISSHNLAELESFVTDVCLIQNGEIVSTSSIKEMKTNDKPSYVIEVDKVEDIKKILDTDDEILDNTHIKVYKEKKDIPEFIYILQKNNYQVFEVRRSELTLEEAFLKKTGGNVID